MGKRSNFERVDKDFYATIDDRAVKALLPHIKHISIYAEPCYGKGHLVDMLNRLSKSECVVYSDIEDPLLPKGGMDALKLTVEDLCGADAIITNPPWSREILHQMILHFKDLAPTWLLFDADWAHTKQSIPYMEFCTDIVSIGRLKWIEGTKGSGKDNCAWYRFDKQSNGITFHPKTILL